MMKKMLKSGLIFMLFLAWSYSGVAQFDSVFNAFQQNVQDDFQSFEKRNEEMFNNFVKKNDEAFANLLKNAWDDYDLLVGEKAPDRPKPDETPTIEPLDVDEDEADEIPVKSQEPEADEPAGQQDDEPSTPPIQRVEPDDFAVKSVAFDFYGVDVNLKFDKDFITAASGTGKQAIVDFWENMVETNHYHFVNQLKSYKSLMNLNDYGFYSLLRKASGEIASDANTEKLLTWFFLTKSRYKTKIAYSGNTMHLLLPSKNMMYGKSYYTFNGIKYFMMGEQGGNIKTYDGDYPDAQMLMDFDVKKPVNLGEKIKEKTLAFNYKGNDYSFPVKYNKYNIDFYDDYPLVEMKVYFDAAMSQVAKESIIKGLKPIIKDKSETDAAGVILKFVQTGFGYKTDDEQFGREKFFFAEELLHFPYSDCEDRSVLFGYLIREMLNREVVGLGYPGHMATAVNFSGDIGRDYFMHKGKKFTICDPTYTGAPIGMCMPQFVDKEAEIIEMENFQVEAYSRKQVWDKVTASGGYPGGVHQTIVFDDDGNAYLTGFIADKAEFGGNTYKTDNNEAFVAKYDKNFNLRWIRMLEGKGNDAGMSVGLDKKGHLYVKGSYEDELNARELRLEGTHEYDIFVAKFSTDGDLGWLKTLPVDEGAFESDKILAGRFSPNGKHLATITFEETGTFSNYGISYTADDEVLVTVSFSGEALASAKKGDMRYDAGFRYSPVEYWKTESQRLIEKDYERTIAGLFAFMRSMKASGTMVEGDVIQEALMEYNPSFRKNTPKIYKNIGRISIMKNAGGIITIRTKGGESVSFRQFMVENDAKLRITTYKGGNAQFNFLSGASLGDSFIRFDLNFIKLMKDTGNLVFDYDDDHSRKVVNLQKDILN